MHLRFSRPPGFPWNPRSFLAVGSLFLLSAFCAVSPARAHACVWKVTDTAGHTLYLAGSVHQLRASDYPLPAAYDQAYAASAALSFESEKSPDGRGPLRALSEEENYPFNGKLKDHVDPRTYAYILRVISNAHGSAAPEKQIEHLRAWALAFMVESPDGLPGVSGRWGVETHFTEKARHDHKEMSGLVSFKEHVAVFSRMNDADSEATLLLAFIHLNTGGKVYERTVADWKRGDIVAIGRSMDEDYADAPALERHMLAERNARWMPKLEGYLRSGKTWMVIAGAGHMAGNEGLPAQMRARGYQVEQL